jgi:hypothetical protein
MHIRALFGALAVAAVAAVPAARAQDVRVTAPAPALPDDEAQKPLTREESEILGRALMFDPSALVETKSARPLRPRGLSPPAGLDVKDANKPDGSRTVTVKRPLPLAAPDLAGSLGADIQTAAPPPSVYQPNRPLPGTVSGDGGSAAAWASLGYADFATVDARVDPVADQGKIAGTLKHALPVGKDLSVTLEDRYAVIENFNPVAPAPSVATLAGPPPATAQPQVFDNSKSVKFNVLPTGTTLGAGWSSASNDPVTHNTLSAEQKLLGPLHVTTSVTDPGQQSENKSITAGFKFHW